MNEEIDSLNQKLDALSDLVFPKPIDAMNEVSKVLAFYGIEFHCENPEEENVYRFDVDGSPKQYYLYIAVNHELTTHIYAQLVDEKELDQLLEIDPEELAPDQTLVPTISRYLRQTRRTADD